MRALQVLAWMSKRADGLGGGLNRVKPEFSANQYQANVFSPPPPRAKPWQPAPLENKIKAEKALKRNPNMGPSYPALTTKAMPEPEGYAPNIDPKHQELFDMHKKEMSEWANARTLPQLFNTSAKAYSRDQMNNYDMDWASAVKNQENLYNLQNARVIPKNVDNVHPSSIFNDYAQNYHTIRRKYLNNGQVDANTDWAIRTLGSVNFKPQFDEVGQHKYLQPQGRYTKQKNELDAILEAGSSARRAPLIPHEQRVGR